MSSSHPVVLAVLASLGAGLLAGCGSTGAPRQTASASGSLASGAVRVLARYPRGCLLSVPRPAGSGLVAAVRGGTVTIASLAGGGRIVLLERLPSSAMYLPGVQWSADGRFLATGDGKLWTAAGRPAGRLLDRLASWWSWSPTGECALGFTGSAAQVTVSLGVPSQRPRAFLRGAIERFAFTPDGRALVLVVATGPGQRYGFFELNLVAGKLREIARLPAADCCVSFGGWAPSGETLLFWAGPGDSVMADGWPLSGLDLEDGGRVIAYGTRRPFLAPAGRLPAAVVLPVADFLAGCGRRLLAVTGFGRLRPTIADKRLVYLAPGKPPRPVTPSTLAYLFPACSRGGGMIAAVQFRNGERADGRARLALLSGTGAFLRYLTPAGPFTDSQPEWAAPGILFARTPSGGGASQLWFAPPGLGARDTGLQASEWDWSATPPSGVS
jgi:hypothetical protein